MLGTWGHDKRRRRHIVITAIAMVGFIAACNATTYIEERDPSDLSVMYTGCDSVHEGPVCEFPKRGNDHTPIPIILHIKGELPFHVVAQSNEGTQTWQVAECAEPDCVITSSGIRYRVDLNVSTTKVIVQTKGHNNALWELGVQPYRLRPKALSDARALESHGTRKAAIEELLRMLPTLSPEWQAHGMSHLARLYKRMGNAEDALTYFNRSMQLHKETGQLSDFVRDATAATHTLVMDAGVLLGQAKSMAARMRGILPDHFESQHFYHWASLFVANKGHMHAEALFHGRKGIEIAEHMGKPKFKEYHSQFMAHTLKKMGRTEAAERLLNETVAQIDLENTQCRDAEHFNTLGFIQWLRFQEESGSKAASTAKSAFDNFMHAYQIATKTCIDSMTTRAELYNSMVNLALGHLALRDTEGAQNLVRELRKHEDVGLFHRQWASQLQAEIHLRRHQPEAALKEFDTLRTLSSGSTEPYLRLWSLLGSARAHQLRGDLESATGRWQDATKQIEQEGLLVPIHENRELFLAQHQRILGEFVEALVDANKIESALQIVREARSQLLRGLTWQERIQNLDPLDEIKWHTALGKYKRLRNELSEARKKTWTIAGSKLQQHERMKEELEQQVATAFHSALSVLEYDGTLPPKPRTPRRGEIFLTHYQTHNAWYQFVTNQDETRIVSIPQNTYLGSPEDVSKALLEPIAPLLRRAKSIVISPWGSLNAVDFHALPFAGKPLAATAAVSYELQFTTLPRSNRTTKNALLVVDPAGNLPKARQEAQLVSAALQSKGISVSRTSGKDATAGTLQKQLQDAYLFHYAGHGLFEESDSTQSALLLADETKLSVGDILALDRVPEVVVLSACETATVESSSPQVGLGIAQAFLTAGAKHVIASQRKVDDGLSRFIMEKFYTHLKHSNDLAKALNMAQKEAYLEDPESDWSTYRLLSRY